MGPRPDVHAVEQPEVAVAHCLERPKQGQARGYTDPREHLFDEGGQPEFIVFRLHSSFFYIVGHQLSRLGASISGFKPPCEEAAAPNDRTSKKKVFLSL